MICNSTTQFHIPDSYPLLTSKVMNYSNTTRQTAQNCGGQKHFNRFTRIIYITMRSAVVQAATRVKLVKMCIIPAVLQYVTVRQTVHTQKFITVTQKAACFGCTGRPSSLTFLKYKKAVTSGNWWVYIPKTIHVSIIVVPACCSAQWGASFGVCVCVWVGVCVCVCVCVWPEVHNSVYYERHNILYRCPRGNVPDFGRMFLTLKYTDITQNTYIRSWTVTEIMAKEKCESMTAVTHLLITKYNLNRPGICSLCNVNICT